MSNQPTVFNPFGGDSSANVAASQASTTTKKQPYKTTGVSARDMVRKTLYETFTSEGHSEAESVQVCEALESAIIALISDPKSRQYRDKARQLKLKL
mmetsp:Transcript_17073/g.21581  ORF Transcript_17073/g.21581 Transcript_17073/m.21581 type:complete len:97 (+) Transcript_17073:44-334(+)